MKIQAIPLALSIALIAGPSISVAAAMNDSPAELTAQATITLQDAIKPALAKVPDGRIQYAELEIENGKLVWSFAITMPKSANITMVAVDANTGDVISTWVETPENQAKDEAYDANESVDDASGTDHATTQQKQ